MYLYVTHRAVLYYLYMKNSPGMTETTVSANEVQPVAGRKKRKVRNVPLYILAAATLVTVVLPLLAFALFVWTFGDQTDGAVAVVLLFPFLFCGMCVTLANLLYVPLYLLRHRPKGVRLITSVLVLLASVGYVFVIELFLH